MSVNLMMRLIVICEQMHKTARAVRCSAKILSADSCFQTACPTALALLEACNIICLPEKGKGSLNEYSEKPNEQITRIYAD